MGLGQKMFHGIAWSGMGRITVQVVQFTLGIILARILSPDEYGILGLLIVFISISDVFIDSGFTSALIQKQERTEVDISTVFIFNLGISVAFYSMLFVAAPYVADFYEIPMLSLLLRVLAFDLILDSLIAIPSALLTIKLDFKTLTKINFVSILLSGLLAIYLAYSGFGVWALVWQSISQSVVGLLLMWFVAKWKPSWVFSMASLKGLFAYGSNLLASSVINVVVNNLYALLIAKFISTKDLGYYSRGTQFSDFVFGSIGAVLDDVLFPGLSTIQKRLELLVTHTRTIIKSTALIIFPISCFLSLMAEPIIKVLLTDKWLLAVPIMQIFCIARGITIISGININLLYVIGRTDLTLKQQYVKIGIRIVLFVAALKYGIIYIALAELVATTMHFFVNTYYPGKIMQYGAFSQLKDMRFIILASLLMVGILYGILYFIDSDILKLCIAPVLALPLYFGLIKLFRVPELTMLVGRAREFVGK